MDRAGIKDILSGLIFVGFGAAFGYAATGYPLGTAFRMGPGYFPLAPRRRASSSSASPSWSRASPPRRRTRPIGVVPVAGRPLPPRRARLLRRHGPRPRAGRSRSSATAFLSALASRAERAARGARDRRGADRRLRRRSFTTASGWPCRCSAPGSRLRWTSRQSRARLRDGALAGQPALLLRRRAARHPRRRASRHRADRDDRDAAADHLLLRRRSPRSSCSPASTTARSTAARRRRS